MSLNEYRRKRVFSKTPEPESAPEDSAKHSQEKTGGNRFFIQRHSARRLHYDLRLEMNGALRSWALPHGPTLDPAVKRLAVLVEDHPLEYGNFEGTIPSGNYGAGQVILWDRGTYEWLGTKTPEQQWESGDLKLVFHGQRLAGEFALVRTQRSKGKDWLLIKKKDFAVREGWDPESDTRSILPARTELASLEGAVQAPMPGFFPPMLAVLSEKLPAGTDWLYEIKWDGVRGLCFIETTENEKKVRAFSRRGNKVETQYPELQALAEVVQAESAILDGEIVCFDANGIPSFQLLQNRIGARPSAALKLAQSPPANFFAFDLLYLNGYDLRRTPLVERKQLLASILQPHPAIRYSEHFAGKGEELMEAVRQKGLEGLVAKQAYSRYESKRSRDWAKVKVVSQQDFVICGWLEGERDYFGALLLAYYEGDRLVYAGNVGSGFSEESLRAISQKLKPLAVSKSPLSVVPKDIGAVTWTKPELVCSVRFTSWTNDMRLRAPVFLGMRHDQTPRECVRETGVQLAEAAPQSLLLPSAEQNEVLLTVEGRRLKFTNVKKVFYPQEGYSKRDVINFYAGVADLLVPYLRGRPLSLRRYPNGIDGESFFQKDAPAGIPDWLRTEMLSDEESRKRYIIADDKASLLYLANLGCIDQNPWMSRVGSLENPDFILIDLDPYHCGYDRIVEAALLVRQKLEMMGLEGYPKTTGGDGMHIYVPLEPVYTFQQSRSFAEILARWLAAERPEIFTTPRTVAAREKGKVYFDYLQNSSGKTISAPYVLRAYPGAPVATPLHWNEVRPGLKPTQFHIANALRRFERTGDLFAGVLSRPQRMEGALEKISAMMGR
jgi:bifunctional non-homologous end joining protein LigD